MICLALIAHTSWPCGQLAGRVGWGERREPLHALLSTKPLRAQGVADPVAVIRIDARLIGILRPACLAHPTGALEGDGVGRDW